MPENKKIKLDIGSGRPKFKDYITVDNDPSVGADLCWDIEKDNGIETIFKINKVDEVNIGENTVDEIRAHHILEHCKTENKVKIMSLFYAMLKPGGILDIEVPLFPHPQSVQDPTHISFWNKASFWYFTKGRNFGESFAKRYSKYPVPLFEKVSEEDMDWKYRIIFKKPL